MKTRKLHEPTLKNIIEMSLSICLRGRGFKLLIMSKITNLDGNGLLSNVAWQQTPPMEGSIRAR